MSVKPSEERMRRMEVPSEEEDEAMRHGLSLDHVER